MMLMPVGARISRKLNGCARVVVEEFKGTWTHQKALATTFHKLIAHRTTDRIAGSESEAESEQGLQHEVIYRVFAIRQDNWQQCKAIATNVHCARGVLWNDWVLHRIRPDKTTAHPHQSFVIEQSFGKHTRDHRVRSGPSRYRRRRCGSGYSGTSGS